MKKFFVISILFFILSGIMIFMGNDKMTNYRNYSTLDSTSSLSSSLNKNAYVGGDAYNYIINSNYATGFFVLATLFAILGIGTIIVGYLRNIEILNEEIHYFTKRQFELNNSKKQ